MLPETSFASVVSLFFDSFVSFLAVSFVSFNYFFFVSFSPDCWANVAALMPGAIFIFGFSLVSFRVSLFIFVDHQKNDYVIVI